MALRRLEDQVEMVREKIINAQLSGAQEDIGQIGVEFTKLTWMIEGLTSYVEHRWQVKLFFTANVVSELVDIRAEHLEEAREKAIGMVDEFASAIRYELYCDGKLIPEEDG